MLMEHPNFLSVVCNTAVAVCLLVVVCSLEQNPPAELALLVAVDSASSSLAVTDYTNVAALVDSGTFVVIVDWVVMRKTNFVMPLADSGTASVTVCTFVAVRSYLIHYLEVDSLPAAVADTIQ